MKELVKRKITRFFQRKNIFKLPVKKFRPQKYKRTAHSFTIDGFHFKEVLVSQRGDSLIGVDINSKAFLKIGLQKHPRKARDVDGEIEVIRHLNNQGALSCPQLLSSGSMSLEVNGSNQKVNYFIVEFVQSISSCPLPDLVLAVLEQKSLGVYQGDLKPENISFSNHRGHAIIIDYDQAVFLPANIAKGSTNAFFLWCDNYSLEKFGIAGWARHFKRLTRKHMDKLFSNDSFNLALTSLYLDQKTTNSSSGIYHSIDTPMVYANGVRDLSDRESILNKIQFKEHEQVLDIGCNVGLLASYLTRRGCKVTGFELDKSIVLAARFVSNINGDKITFAQVDLDSHVFTQQFDTIFLFSVFHHTKDLVKNGINIANACNRIIIECRLVESGKKPIADVDRWEDTSSWNFDSLEQLCFGLQKFFPGFHVKQNHGLVDKSRYIIELVKS